MRDYPDTYLQNWLFSKICRRLVLGFCFFAMSLPLFAEKTPFLVTPVSAAGSGGMHVAAEEGVYTLLGNPALLNAVSQSMFVALSGGIEDFFKDGAFQVSMPYTVAGPLAIGTISKGVGYGLFNYIRFHEDGTDIHFIGSAGIDWILVDTASLKLDFGLSPRLLFSYALTEYSHILSALSLTPGVLCTLGDWFSVGISCADAISGGFFMDGTGSTFTYVSSSLDVGLSALIISNAALGLTLFADYRNILRSLISDTGEPMRRFGGGIRAEFGNSFWLSLGLFELSPTAGFGLNLGVIRLETAFFANGVEAGIRIVRN
jgi:hypothetical protein